MESDYSWSGSGFTTRTPSWTIGKGSWKSDWDKIKERRYTSSLGYSGSSYYDYTSSSYYSTWGKTYTNTEDSEAVEKLLTSAYKSVREAVVILDFPYKVDICFSSDTFFKKNQKNRRIFLSTKILDNKGVTDAEKIDILCGSGIHEASHLKYTEIRIIDSFLNHIENFIEKNISKILINVIEDERVEDRLLRERPGYSEFIVKKKDSDYDKSKFFSTYSSENNCMKLISNVIKFIRFKTKFDVNEVPPEQAPLFDKIEEGMSSIYGKDCSTKYSCIVAKNIVKDILNYTEENYYSEAPTLEKLELDKYSDFYTQVLSGTDVELAEVDGLKSKLREQQTDLVGGETLRIKEKLASGEISRDGKTLIRKDIEGSLPEYTRIRDSILPLVPAMRKVLVAQNKSYDFVIHGCRSGLLDTTKLAEAYQGVPQVYSRMGHVRTSNTAICILVDESGSMGCWHAGSTRSRFARQASVLLNEAFGGLPGVDLFIYGHTADSIEEGTTELYVYREPGYTINEYKSLSKISAKYENRDGDAIYSAAKRVRSFTDSFCTMFVISDGEPCAYYYGGWEAIEDTKKKIKKVQTTLNMKVMGICITDEINGKDIYDSYVDLKDLAELPKQLGKLVSKTIMDSRETVTS